MTIYWSNVIRTSGIARTKIYHFVQDIFDKLLTVILIIYITRIRILIDSLNQYLSYRTAEKPNYLDLSRAVS